MYFVKYVAKVMNYEQIGIGKGMFFKGKICIYFEFYNNTAFACIRFSIAHERHFHFVP